MRKFYLLIPFLIITTFTQAQVVVKSIDELAEWEKQKLTLSIEAPEIRLPSYDYTSLQEEKRKRIKLAKPEGESSFLLTFNETGEISGLTSTNTAFGTYRFSNDSILEILKFTNTTELNELYNGAYFIASMNKVFSSTQSSKGLALYYDSQKPIYFC
jgi:hypothetical protein